MKVYQNGDPQEIFLEAMNMACEPKYTIDNENIEQIRDLVSYFSLGESKLDRRKGIVIIGNPGSGKTLLMEIFQALTRNLPWAFRTVHCPMLTVQYDKFGSKIYENYIGSWFFDDLCREEIGNHFGSKREVMLDIVFKSYDDWRKRGTRIFMTSNDSPEKIENRYGAHFWSRLNQMCNVIGLGLEAASTDRRKISTPVTLAGKVLPKFFQTEEEMYREKEVMQIHKSYERLKKTEFIPHLEGSGSQIRRMWEQGHPNAFILREDADYTFEEELKKTKGA